MALCDSVRSIVGNISIGQAERGRLSSSVADGNSISGIDLGGRSMGNSRIGSGFLGGFGLSSLGLFVGSLVVSGERLDLGVCILLAGRM